MVTYTLNSNGECSNCKTVASEETTLKCEDCKKFVHAICGSEAPYASKTFVANFNKVKVKNFLFLCDFCLTKRENNEASTLKDQMENLTETVKTLVKDIQSLKSIHKTDNEVQQQELWSDKARVKKMNSSLCIQSNGKKVDLAKVQEIATNNSIQVSRTTVKENGDVFMDLPSDENREKLTPLLQSEAFAEHKIVELKSKLPTISILDVKDFSSKEEFIEQIKLQNHNIKHLIEEGHEFSIVYCKNPRETANNENKHFQIVVRVGVEIRKAIKANKDKIFMNLSAYRVVDRFYVKRCNKCQKFGHYEKDCQNEMCCGYCCSHEHMSKDCKTVQPSDHKSHACINCKDTKRKEKGHSSMWYKCPAYMEMQNKVKKTIPYYQKN